MRHQIAHAPTIQNITFNVLHQDDDEMITKCMSLYKKNYIIKQYILDFADGQRDDAN